MSHRLVQAEILLAMLWLSGCTTAASPAATATASPMPSLTATSPEATLPTNLQVTGSLNASTDPTAGPPSCDYGLFVKDRVRFVTTAMTITAGSTGVIRVQLYVLPSLGAQAANGPLLLSGITPVGIQQSPTSTSGATSGVWSATSGTVVVTAAQQVGQHGRSGQISGTLDVQLAQNGGAKPLHLTGQWACDIPPSGNG